jgi:CRISPR/Cas system CSM-associated protein Csm3 (group 7 of RAMP superfamily)
MMELLNLHIKGITTSPWFIKKKEHPNYIYCEKFLWGRAIRGIILNYLLRNYCKEFHIKCKKCFEKNGCPFYNIYGNNNDEDKDMPKFIISSLFFEKIKIKKAPILSRDFITNGTSKFKTIEYIDQNSIFEFEIVLKNSSIKFSDHIKEAIENTLDFIGWGGMCSKGYGRGKIIEIKEYDFDKWINKIDERMKKFEERKEIELEIFPLLILEDNGKIYKKIESNFKKKLINSINERYWQFFKENRYLNIKEINGNVSYKIMNAYSKKEKRFLKFEGIAGTLKLLFEKHLNKEELRMIGIAKYGIGRYKNQGFGSLILKGDNM